MIPILYAGNETNFLNNGLGRLSDAIKCTVEEERNGTYELEMTYPITGIHFEDIQESNIILARSEDGGVNQAFIIYKISKPLNGIVTINAQHISYLLNGFVVMPFTASSLADAMSKINTNAVLTTGFTFSTDVSITKPFTLDAPRSIRSLLGGEEGSLLDTYGGHDYYFNNFNVSLLADRGNDNGVTIRYGKNLTDLKAVSDMTNVYTGIVPFWADSEGGNPVYVDGYVVYSEHASTYPYKYIKPVDFSSDFETAPSKAQLLARAQSYLENNDGWKIKSNIEVSFVSLAQTEEYKEIAPLERVKLCDTVTVEYTKLGVSFKTKVIRTVFNVLLERYDSIELGDTTYTLAQAILQANDTPTLQETTSAIQSAVQNATKLIRGGLGGHVVMMADGNGLPQEILIMDTDNITTAQKVWRWNLGGLGYSNTGYEGNYGTAITMDGQIVANFITVGTLNAAVIKTGTIQDDKGLNSWNLDTGAFSLQSGATVGGKTVSTIASEASSTAVTNFINNTYSHDLQNIEGQIDGKAETWYQSSDPATNWSTAEDKQKHKGDLWYNTTNDTTWYYAYDSGTQTYSWEQQNIPTAEFDEIDGKAQIFITQPTPPYNVGDLWCKGANDGIYNCVTAKAANEHFNVNDWEEKNNYVDTAAVNTAISTYDTSLNQKKVFDKLTLNGTKQGIFLDEQTGDLYVNGAWIQANTISANALTAQAKQDLQEKHNYLVNDVFADINNWHTDGNNSTFSYETIDGVKYFVIDATNVTEANKWNDVVYTALKLSGNISLKVHFVYYIDRAITISAQRRFPVVDYYRRSDGENRITWYNIPAQSVPANREFTWDITLTPSDVDADANANFGFYPFAGCKMYFKEITVTSSIDSYATSGMNFNADGLELLASKVDADNTHNYLPFDMLTNTARWVTVSWGVWHGGFAFGLSDITSGGKTYTAANFDGTTLAGDGQVFKELVSDVVGLTTVNYSFNIQVTADATLSEDFAILKLRNKNREYGSSTTNTIVSIPSGTQLTANTEYTYSGTYTPSLEIDPNNDIASFLFQFLKGSYLRVYNIQITSTSKVYKNATLKYTADGLDSVVQAGSIISQINQSAETVSIKASKIDLQGDLSLHGDFTSYDPNYDPDDPTTYTYAFMDSGSISFFNENANVFTVSCTELLNDAGAGIFFGDAEDPQTLTRYTVVSQNGIRTPKLYVRETGDHEADWQHGSTVGFACEGYSIFYNQCDISDHTDTPENQVWFVCRPPASFYRRVYFYGEVINSGGGVQFISDMRKKRSIKDLAIDKAKSFIMGLKPKKFKFTKDLSHSDRYHHGFIAQEVKEVMPEDWGVYCENVEDDFIGLRYDELIADMVAVIQDQEKRIEALERAIHDKSNN